MLKLSNVGPENTYFQPYKMLGLNWNYINIYVGKIESSTK